MSSMKRPRPVRSAESSTRAIDCPTQVGADPAWAEAWLVASAIPERFSRTNTASGKAIQRRLGPAISADLETYHPVSFRSGCAVQYQLARRETLRNSRGLTPLWLRKKRVKCAGCAKPSWWLMSAKLAD